GLELVPELALGVALRRLHGREVALERVGRFSVAAEALVGRADVVLQRWRRLQLVGPLELGERGLVLAALERRLAAGERLPGLVELIGAADQRDPPQEDDQRAGHPPSRITSGQQALVRIEVGARRDLEIVLGEKLSVLEDRELAEAVPLPRHHRKDVV